MTSQLWAPCVVCGREAKPAGEHHFREHDTAVGKQMGGTHDHLETMVICREHHEALHNRTLTIVIDGATVTSQFAGKPPIVRTETTDEELCDLWAAGDLMGKRGIVMQARAAMEFRARYGAYSQNWYGRAAELIRENTGCPVSQTTIYDRAALGIFLQTCGDDAEQALMTLGTKVATAVGKASDPVAALEQAHAGRDEGRRMTDVAREIALSGKSAKELPCESAAHRCKWCSEEWQ